LPALDLRRLARPRTLQSTCQPFLNGLISINAIAINAISPVSKLTARHLTALIDYKALTQKTKGKPVVFMTKVMTYPRKFRNVRECFGLRVVTLTSGDSPKGEPLYSRHRFKRNAFTSGAFSSRL
jgi:hypothetical protein